MRDTARILKMAELALIDAMVFQEVLTASYQDVPTLSKILSQRPIKQGLIDAWRKILKKNYAPIFELGLSILIKLPANPLVEEALEILIREAEEIASSRALLRHDLMGRIYHRLLMAEIAKYYATYYTSVPAAWLLARLVLDTENPAWNVDWSNIDNISKFKIGDLACGSGTLLSASYRAILDKHIIESASKGLTPNLEGLHRILIEEVLWGFDVLTYATHLALTGLSLHNPSVIFQDAKIYTLPLTATGEDIYLGSIDFLRDAKIRAMKTFVGISIAPEKRSMEAVEAVPVELPRFNLIIMNPPFTRSVGGNLLFGALPQKERKKLQKKLSEILEKEGFRGIGQAGLGAVFIVLSDKYLENEGRLALVAPRSLLSGVAWTKIRELLHENYHVEYIITSHQAPNDWNFSENTDLSEILLVARKSTEKDRTIIVNLWRKPANEMEAIIIASQLVGLKRVSIGLHDVLENTNASHFNITLGGKKIGEAYTVTPDAIKETITTWGRLAPFAQSELNRMAYFYVNSGTVYIPGRGTEGVIPTVKLKFCVETIGPDVRQIHSSFKAVNRETPFNALWDHKSEEVKTIRLDVNKWLEPKPGKAGSAKKLWGKSGRLMIVERLWLNTHRITAALLSVKALSNMWWPLRLKNAISKDEKKISRDEHEKVQVLWLNTTLGIIGLLAYRQDTRGAWIKFKKNILEYIPILDVSKIEREQIDLLLSIYNSISTKELPSFPDQFERAASGAGIRYELDEGVLNAIGLSLDLKPLYHYLSKEPIISLKSL